MIQEITPRHETRETILDAANRHLQHYGYRKMTMEEIAQEAGIGKATIYCYFRSKEEVALSVIDRLNGQLRQRLSDIAHSNTSPPERLEAMLLERVLFRFDAIQCTDNSLDELMAALRVPMRARKRAYLEAETNLFTELLEEGKQTGHFDFESAHTTACALVMATNSLMPYALTRYELGTRDDVRQRTLDIVHLLLRGLEHRES